MSEFIFSRAAMYARGMAAFDRGLSRDDHNMNPGSAAIEDWQAGWDLAAQNAKLLTGARAAS